MSTLKLKRKHIIKIPKTVSIIYCKKRNLLTFIGPLKTKTLKLQNKIIFFPKTNSIGISKFLINNTSTINHEEIQGTVISKIKDILIEINYNLYYKLKFIGVGYRAFELDYLKNQFYFKLGYSHLIYFKIPKPLNSFCIKYTKIFIFGNVSLEDITKTTALLRQCKKPEPYKGKGILYHNEKIQLKKGKKI